MKGVAGRRNMEEEEEEGKGEDVRVVFIVTTNQEVEISRPLIVTVIVHRPHEVVVEVKDEVEEAIMEATAVLRGLHRLRHRKTRTIYGLLVGQQSDILWMESGQCYPMMTALTYSCCSRLQYRFVRILTIQITSRSAECVGVIDRRKEPNTK
jgi:hypothetical protein